MGPFSLPGILKVLQAVGPAVAALPEFADIFNNIKTTFNTSDQAVLQKAYEALKKNNAEGHEELQHLLSQVSGE